MRMVLTIVNDNGKVTDTVINDGNYKEVIKRITNAYDVSKEQSNYAIYNTATKRTRCSLAVIESFISRMCRQGDYVCRLDRRIKQSYEQAVSSVAKFHSIPNSDVKLCLTDRLGLTEKQLLDLLYKLYFSRGNDTSIFKEVLSLSRGMFYQADSDTAVICIQRVQALLSTLV